MLLVFFLLTSYGSVMTTEITTNFKDKSATSVGRAIYSYEDWYNEFGFPQQFFWGRWVMFKVALFFMLAFLKIFLLLGIWTPKKDELEELPTLYQYDGQHYGYSSWQPYG
ncbi:uncharacterized protein LOC129751777 [Uranotaenia lowii]|uniref:uncharacterized protein LOC129751777 n=1 Tax=Uranotaenia lowii TaxID=190385 RepID=UPI002478CE77|nr:uncharacterized protein LOC129751777 [Uranotaenia lowii]